METRRLTRPPSSCAARPGDSGSLETAETSLATLLRSSSRNSEMPTATASMTLLASHASLPLAKRPRTWLSKEGAGARQASALALSPMSCGAVPGAVSDASSAPRSRRRSSSGTEPWCRG